MNNEHFANIQYINYTNHAISYIMFSKQSGCRMLVSKIEHWPNLAYVRSFCALPTRNIEVSLGLEIVTDVQQNVRDY